jgi:hypothetical protein
MGSGLDLGGIEAVLFDFDGTLVHLNIDFGRMRAEVEALVPQYGLSMEGRRALYVLELIEDAVRELEAQDEGRARAFRQETEETIVAIELEAAAEAQVPGSGGSHPGGKPAGLRRAADAGRGDGGQAGSGTPAGSPAVVGCRASADTHGRRSSHGRASWPRGGGQDSGGTDGGRFTGAFLRGATGPDPGAGGGPR